VPTVKTNVLLAVFFAACVAQTQTLRIVPANLDPISSFPDAIQFHCTENYNKAACLDDSLALREALGRYPVAPLGSWWFVLVPADEWKSLVLSLGGDPVSPALTSLGQRTTVMDRSLFRATAHRKKELSLRFTFSDEALLDLAIRHELGHSICNDRDERHAAEYGQRLREKKEISCGTAFASDDHLPSDTESRSPIVDTHMQNANAVQSRSSRTGK
jgi:hypothetical protein